MENILWRGWPLGMHADHLVQALEPSYGQVDETLQEQNSPQPTATRSLLVLRFSWWSTNEERDCAGLLCTDTKYFSHVEHVQLSCYDNADNMLASTLLQKMAGWETRRLCNAS